MRRALILGCGGMDGSFLADILLEKGSYEVHGMHRRSSTGNLSRLAHLPEGAITLHQGDMADPISVRRIIEEVCPDEIYNVADQDNVDHSFATVGYSMDITAAAVGRLLEICRTIKYLPQIKLKVFQPCTAMMFGNVSTPYQNEHTHFNPQSPYACAKVAAFYLARHYRNEYGMFVSTAILYNHDSARRTDDYLLHHICKGAVTIKAGLKKTITIGDPNYVVDIGYARDYMETVWRMMQLNKPDDFVIGSGCAITIQELIDEAFSQVGLTKWDAQDSVEIDPKFNRPGKRSQLCADPSKINNILGARPRTSLRELISMIIGKYQKGIKNG